MKQYFILLIWSSYIPIILANSVCEDKTLDPGHWFCATNPDGTVNVTYDCLNVEKSIEIWIWSEKLPKDLNALNIQNCEALNLNLHKGDDLQPFAEFRYLNVVNVSELTILSIDYRCVPPNVVLTNITIKELIHLDRNCESKGFTLKSLLLQNVSVNALKDNFISSHHLRKFIMEEVKIKYTHAYAINIQNDKGTVKITNSIIEELENDFINVKVSEVTLSNNFIMNFKEPTHHHQELINYFSFEADKVNLNGNKFKVLTDSTLKITSNDIKITDNIFQRVDEKAFDNISPATATIDSSPKTSNSFNFSNNLIYSLAPGALMIKPDNKSRNAIFTNVTIFNNSVNCMCDNMFWFESVAHNKDNVRNYFNYKWAKKTNQNKCLNIPKCDVTQVLQNYHDLCEENYKCSEMALGEGKEKVLNFINYNNEMGRETSKLLEILIDQFEEKKVFKSSDTSRADQKNYLQALIQKSQMEEEKKWMNILNLSQISSCLLIMTVMSCGVIAYVLIAKCFSSSFIKSLTSKYRSKGFLTETEMHPSCISDLNLS